MEVFDTILGIVGIVSFIFFVRTYQIVNPTPRQRKIYTVSGIGLLIVGITAVHTNMALRERGREEVIRSQKALELKYNERRLP